MALVLVCVIGIVSLKVEVLLKSAKLADCLQQRDLVLCYEIEGCWSECERSVFVAHTVELFLC